MKKALEIACAGLCFLTLVLGLSGCGTGQASLTPLLDGGFEQDASEKAHIAWYNTYEQDDGFVVAGVVRRNDTVGGPITVNVHAAIVTPGGEVIGEAQSDDIRIPRRTVTKVQGFERFKVHFPSTPPEGASVRLVVCAG
jgi:hypothetical protein